ncbi:uncharacterized protein LOC132760151 [Ruditapes philippinarum]|uniref:uncharacterized protein LOC132760151 n=1 Tax=Ruditapes philippinarum TaxID=129788 RepID=UPI00295BDDD1|nr:uncharacterized protein LOC132760151 [Ruditapes philippinarum]
MKGVFDLNEALSKHFGTENINGFRCERCNTVTAATKGCQLTGLPKNFIISLKRFTRKRRKDTRHIKIPFELRLRPYIDRDLELEDKARLIGMVQHCGVSVTSGHYVAYVEVGMKWFRIDDMRISNITNNALSNEASSSYIYFYKTLPRPYIN